MLLLRLRPRLLFHAILTEWKMKYTLLHSKYVPLTFLMGGFDKWRHFRTHYLHTHHNDTRFTHFNLIGHRYSSFIFLFFWKKYLSTDWLVHCCWNILIRICIECVLCSHGLPGNVINRSHNRSHRFDWNLTITSMTTTME